MSSASDVRKLMAATLFGLAAAVLSTIGPAAAKDAALTQDNVSRFLATFPEMRTLALSEGLRASADSEAAKNPVGAVLKAIKSSKLQSQAKAIAVNHGFADLKEWLDTGKAIGQAYVFVTTGPARGIARATLDKNKEKAIKGLESLGILNDNQKERLKANLDGLSDQLAKEPPAENVAVVKDMKADIEAAVKSGAY